MASTIRADRYRFASALLLLPAVVAAAEACGSDDAPATAPANDGGAAETSTAEGGADAGSVSTALYKSGTRLRAQVVRAGDAVKYEGFFDTARSEACSFQQMPDGTARCVPPSMGITFADAECKSPVAVLEPCLETLKYVGNISTTFECGEPSGGTFELFERGAEVAAPAMIFTKAADGQCVQQGPPGGKVYALGAAIPLTAFVGARAELARVSASVAMEKWLGEDGSELVTGALSDRGRDAGCRVQRVGGPSSTDWRCIPALTAFSDAVRGPFVEDTCGTPAAYSAFSSTCPGVAGIVHFAFVDAGTQPGCSAAGSDLSVSLFDLGAPIPAAFQTNPGPDAGCAPAPPGRQYFRRGAPSDTSALPALTLQTFGSAPVGVRSVTSEGTPVTLGDLWDSARGACTPLRFDDGKTYCVPVNTLQNQVQRFKDAACTQPVVLVGQRCSDGGELIQRVSGTCGDDVYSATVTKLGPVVEVPETWEDDGMGCAGPLPAFPGLGREVLGTATAAATFTAVERATE